MKAFAKVVAFIFVCLGLLQVPIIIWVANQNSNVSGSGALALLAIIVAVFIWPLVIYWILRAIGHLLEIFMA